METVHVSGIDDGELTESVMDTRPGVEKVHALDPDSEILTDSINVKSTGREVVIHSCGLVIVC